MSALLIKHGEWVVVCDGAKALVLENTGDTKFPNLKTVQVIEPTDQGDHAHGEGIGQQHSPGRARLEEYFEGDPAQGRH